METKILTTVNGINILEVENNLVPIKPIYEALGVDYTTQHQKIKSDEEFSQLYRLAYTTGADGKSYQMVCLPLKFIFGWLFNINPNNVKEEIRQSMREYRRSCYDAIYDSLFLHKAFLQDKETLIEEKLTEITALKSEYLEAKTKLTKAETELKQIRNFNFDSWKLQKAQTTMLEQQGFLN